METPDVVVDTNCHLGQFPSRRLEPMDADGLNRLREAYFIADAWVSSFEGIFSGDCRHANRALMEMIKDPYGGLAPWAVINPAAPEWETDVKVAGQFGVTVKGVRLYPNHHGYELSDKRVASLLKALAKAARFGVPVAIYHRVVDERLDPDVAVPPTEMDLEPIVRKFPKQTLLLCGCSLAVALGLAELIRQARVYVETSWLQSAEEVRQLVSEIGAERVVFGSHTPYFDIETALARVDEAGLSSDDRAGIRRRNSLGLFAPQ